MKFPSRYLSSPLDGRPCTTCLSSLSPGSPGTPNLPCRVESPGSFYKCQCLTPSPIGLEYNWYNWSRVHPQHRGFYKFPGDSDVQPELRTIELAGQKAPVRKFSFGPVPRFPHLSWRSLPRCCYLQSCPASAIPSLSQASGSLCHFLLLPGMSSVHLSLFLSYLCCCGCSGPLIFAKWQEC